jgi:hypothetical protein
MCQNEPKKMKNLKNEPKMNHKKIPKFSGTKMKKTILRKLHNRNWHLAATEG